MPLTPDEQAELARLNAKATAPGDDVDPDDVIDAAGTVAAEVGAATAGAVADVAEAVAAAVADAPPAPPAPIVVEEPDPVAVAEAEAVRIQAEADATVQIIDAQAGADIARLEAERATDPDPVGNLLDDTLGPIVTSPPPEIAPKVVHPWFKKLRS
jgi:hypothetical protein